MLWVSAQGVQPAPNQHKERQCRINVLLIDSAFIFSEATEHPRIPIPGTDNFLSCESYAGFLSVSVTKHTVLKQGICNLCEAECFTKDMKHDGSHWTWG